MNAMPFPPRSKYKAKPCVIDGIRFASQREGKRFVALRQLERMGEIKLLELQKPFVLHAPNGTTIGKYLADFVYQDKHGETVVEDAKGFATDLYKWKRKHVFAEYNIEISEV